MDYEINTWDTLERIAASHDCTVGELMKMNRMASRIVFPGMKIRVPWPTDEVFDSNDDRHKAPPPRTTVGKESADDGIRKGPGGAVPSTHNTAAFKDDRSRAATVDSAELDAECLQRFLKVKVKQLTETDGTVGGTLLVTPNCLMFDPDVTHALVREKGSDLYGMVANMDDIMAVALYKDISALTGETDQQKGVYDPDRVAEVPPEEILPSIVEEELANVGERVSDNTVQRRHNSDLSPDVYGPDDAALLMTDGPESRSCPSLVRPERPRAQSDLLASSTNNGNEQSRSRISPRAARRSVVRLGRTLSSRAYSFGGSVASGAQSVAQTAVSSTKSAAHGVVTHTKSAADTLQTGAKVAAGAVASVPQNIVNMSSGLFYPESVGSQCGILDVHDTWFANEDAQRSPTSMKRQQSLATLESLRMKTQHAREEASSKQNKLKFSCATSVDEMPELFRPVQELLPSADDSCASPELPFYLCVRLNRRRRRKRGSAPSVSMPTTDGDGAFGNQLKREFWFAVPRERAEAVYHFLLQWSPDKYGQDNTVAAEHDEKGFLILDADDDEALGGDKPSTPLFSSLLNREWEIVTVEEMRRRLSLSELSLEDLPLPEGATSSRILEEPMIRQMLEILPARAEGYPWVQVYSSSDHGFSLNTLYRKMTEWDEEVSPTLLVVRDTADRVFGAIVSCPLRPCDHFYGTGDSCLLWRVVGDSAHTRLLQSWGWTGDNQLFVKASKDSLAIGAGGGHYGLWLDADLNHGRSMRCATFDNENLAGQEDFIVQQIEAFGFRML